MYRSASAHVFQLPLELTASLLLLVVALTQRKLCGSLLFLQIVLQLKELRAETKQKKSVLDANVARVEQTAVVSSHVR